nr:MAG TPA: hypothetical protein [Caudoviricetes sp.]
MPHGKVRCTLGKNNTGDYSPMLNPQYFNSACFLAFTALSNV